MGHEELILDGLKRITMFAHGGQRHSVCQAQQSHKGSRANSNFSIGSSAR